MKTKKIYTVQVQLYMKHPIKEALLKEAKKQKKSANKLVMDTVFQTYPHLSEGETCK